MLIFQLKTWGRRCLVFFISLAVVHVYSHELVLPWPSAAYETSTSTTKWPPSFGWLLCHCIWCALAYSKSPKV